MRTIQQVVEIVDKPWQTVKDICEQDEESLRTARPTRGAKFKLSREQVLYMERDMEGH